MWKWWLLGFATYLVFGGTVAWFFYEKPMGLLFAMLLNYGLAAMIFGPLLATLPQRKRR